MPIDVAFAFRAHLERAKALFAPDYGWEGSPADEAHVEAIAAGFAGRLPPRHRLASAGTRGGDAP